MKFPREVPVMTLPDATLFPRALLHLHIFEPRFRRMLHDVLHSHRMFAVAMLKPGSTREAPSPVAGLGLIRAAVRHSDGTAHLFLQGLIRVGLEQTVRYRPYRLQRIRLLPTPPCDSVAADALLAKVRELVVERVSQGPPFAGGLEPPEITTQLLPQPLAAKPKEILHYLDSIEDPERAADLVGREMLHVPVERQAILETVDIEARLRRLIQFLLADIRKRRKENTYE
jgi:ATP-dependent Lon protease